MNQRWISRNSCFNWFVTRWAFLASVLAFFGAGGLSPVVASADVVWDTGPFCDGCAVTNIEFVSVEQFDAYTNSLLRQVDFTQSSILLVSNDLDSIRYDAIASTNASHAISDISTAQNVGAGNSLAIRGQTMVINGSCESIIADVDDAMPRVSALSSQCDDIKASIVEGAGVTRAAVATSCETGGVCCCQCPDYTALLTAINANLTNISGDLSQIRTWFNQWIQNMYYRLARLTRGFNSVLGLGSDFDDYAYFLGMALGTNLVYGAHALVAADSLLDVEPFDRHWIPAIPFDEMHQGEALGTSLARIMTMLEQFSYMDSYDYLPDALPFVRNTLDFVDTRNVHPTNTEDNALWVRGFGSNGTISVSGKVDFDESALRDMLASIEFKVINGLQDFHVTVDNTNDFQFLSGDSSERIYSEVQQNFTTIENIADDVRGQAATYDEPDWTLDNYGSAIDFRQDVETWDLIGKWSEMFSSLEISEPGAIMIFDGYSPGDGGDTGTPGPWAGWSNSLSVPPQYWYPMQGTTGTVIRRIRDIFRMLWTIVLLVVIVALVKINWLLVRCGVRILIAVFSVFASPDPVGAVVEVFDTTLKALSQLYAGLLGGQAEESA